MNTVEIDDLVVKIDTLVDVFTPHETDLIIDALEFYKEMQVI